MDAKFLSSMKKYKKWNTIDFESVPLNIKIGFFGTKKEHTFFGFPQTIKKSAIHTQFSFQRYFW